MSDGRPRSRPTSITPGTPALVGAWLVGVLIARLTGSSAVVLVLVAGLVAMAAGAASGWWRLRSIALEGVSTPALATCGAPCAVVVRHRDGAPSTTPVVVDVLGHRRALEPSGSTRLEVELTRAGVFDHVAVRVESAGAAGLVVWRRTERCRVGELHVAPPAAGDPLPVDVAPGATDVVPGRPGARGGGDVDGVRPWRPGEGETAIHWPSTLRSGGLVARERSAAADERWVVAADADPARLRLTLEEALRAGRPVALADHDDEGRPVEVPIVDADAALRASARAAHRRPHDADGRGAAGRAETTRPGRLARRRLGGRRGAGARSGAVRGGDPVPPAARALSGLASLVALWMLLGALGAPPSERAAVGVGVAVATLASMRFTDGRRPWWARSIVVFLAAAALGRIAIEASGLSGLLAALRGPLPDLLVVLVVLHGAEVADRRTNRVHLAISAVVVAYAAGLRIDGRVGWWLLLWGVLAVAASCRTHERHGGRATGAGLRRTATWATAGAVGTLALASLVPVPDGPASLGLPALSPEDRPDVRDGTLVGPDGEAPAAGGAAVERGALGRAGGYPGFTDALDTSVRGDLGDEVVMRVRSPEPAFWRGLTFTDFDGRTWTSPTEPGRRRPGPAIDLDPAIGDRAAAGVETDDLVQTFHVEADLPNVVFAAAAPTTVRFDGDVFERSDGALRADRRLSSGTVYSVVSSRSVVTADDLRAQGDVGARFAPLADLDEIAPLLALPTSTSPRTLELAERLAVPGSTYDTVRAYEAWIADSVEYDLDAPVPDGDAVDDVLFGSRRGFCEQIASALVVMLRSQGVPARLATGYVPGGRDRVAGVWEVRAGDAHAWVEVWFPDTGWEAFDPTASVPLSGDAARPSVGGEAAAAALGAVAARPVEAGAVGLVAIAALGAWRAASELRRRRRRGAWGLLHDRFVALAPGARTAPAAAADVAALLVAHGRAERVDPSVAHHVAVHLDRVAFDPTHSPDDDARRRLTADVAALERQVRSVRSVRRGRGAPAARRG